MTDEALWDVLDEYEAAETGGGGLIGKIKFEIAARTYAGDQEETIGPDVPEDKEPPSKSPAKTEKVER